MITIVALFFPLIFIVAVFKLQPLHLERVLGQNEVQKQYTSPKLRLAILEIIIFFAISSLCALVIGSLQYLLFYLMRTRGSDILFQHSAIEIIPYSFLVGMLLGLIWGIIISTRRVIAKGKEYARSLSTDYKKDFRRLRWIKLLFAPGLAILFTLLNILFASTFIRITDDEIIFRKLAALHETRSPISDIYGILIHNERIAPNKKRIEKKWIEIYFKDGARLDTHYLIEPSHHAPLIEAIQRASKHKIVVREEPLKQKPRSRG